MNFPNNFTSWISLLLLVFLGLTYVSARAPPQPSQYAKFTSAVTEFQKTAKGLSTKIQCRCQLSLNHQATQLSWLAKELKNAFETNPSAQTPQGVPKAIHNVRNSANHLITETVWQSPAVRAALEGIRSEMDKMKRNVSPESRTKNSHDFVNLQKEAMKRLLGYVQDLDKGCKYYKPYNKKS